MPLPLPGRTPWPPPALEVPHADMDMWRAWYSGDTGHLAAVYGGPANYRSNAVAREFFDVDQRRAVGGEGLRMFWGQEPSPGQQAAKLHIPIGADIAEMSANLLWADVPQVTVDADSTDAATARTTQAQIGRYLDDRGHAKLREGAELAAGLSNVYLRVVWDTDLRPRPWPDVIAPDAVVPEWRWGALAAATVWRELDPVKEASEVWRLLEHHTPGMIEYGLYRGDTGTLGQRMDLGDHTDSEYLAKRTDTQGRQSTGIPRLLITHMPNLLPNRVWDGLPGTAPLGRSDFAGIEPMMDALDEAWTSWMRDLRLGKARVVVPQTMLDTAGPGQGASFDLDKELIVALSGLLGAETMKDSITEVQFKIRVEEHERTTKALRLQILSSAGYSAQGFGEAGTIAATATEVVARKEESLTTRGTKILYQRPALIEFLTTMMMVDVVHCGAKGVDPAVELTASWPQAVQPDQEATARALSLLDGAGAISTFMAVKQLHPEWDDLEVKAEVQRIREDKSAVVPAGDPFSTRGGEPDEPNDEEAATEDGPEAGADEGQDEEPVGGGSDRLAA
ncbi:A118 family predicted phage portal protein [Streptomyces sp. KhCrAH-43]|uniref:phage portal protein n=1 Tax=unclassified Streptomyces TaxID=2593676 RepID=UPI00039A89A9|nr:MULTISPECIES: phage portal protein [unclassified Streptomyces]MYX67371.1 phage portal protein [Streptomyces sp. SID8373]RAJ53783.1 A118 family predicted phage portal protein [Streptomyces sp. KhCrAH-43]